MNNMATAVPKKKIQARNRTVLVQGSTTFKNMNLTEELTTMKQQQEVDKDNHENTGIQDEGSLNKLTLKTNIAQL